MRIRALANVDIIVGNARKAAFPGQEYDVPDDAGHNLVNAGLAERVVGGGTEPTSEKAVHGPPEDKMLKRRPGRPRKQ